MKRAPAPARWIVRRMVPADAAAVAVIAAQSPEAGQWTPGDYERLTQGECDAWVAEAAEGPVGYLEQRSVADEVEILNLAVGLAQRRRGIGTALLEAVLAGARSADAKRVYLEVRASNDGAIAFYQRHKFAPVGRRPRYYSEPVEDALILMRPVGEVAR